MQISALLEDLHCLKRDIEIVIEQAESVKDEYVNPDIKNHVVICKKQLSSIHELINDSNIERELSDKKKKTNNSNIKRELTDDKKEKSKADNNSPPDNQSHQSDVDDLDDLNFDEFVLETTSSEDVKNLPQLTSKNQVHLSLSIYTSVQYLIYNVLDMKVYFVRKIIELKDLHKIYQIFTCLSLCWQSIAFYLRTVKKLNNDKVSSSYLYQ